MRVLTVIPTLNQEKVLRLNLDNLIPVTRGDILVLDNGSGPAIREIADTFGTFYHRLERNIGNYPTFAVGCQLALEEAYDVVVFIHSDFLIYEPDWDTRLASHFEADPSLGLVHFVGSTETDENGGRGFGTMLNFMGRNGGSPAEAHGKRHKGFVYGTGGDGCAMAFRTLALKAIGQRESFPPHHFYDRLMPCQMLEAGWAVAYLGIECDHLGGYTAGREKDYHSLAQEWCEARGIASGPNDNWDLAIYLEAERQFLTEYRDQKHFIPCAIRDGKLVHFDRQYKGG